VEREAGADHGKQVERAFALAQPSGVVLFAPACAPHRFHSVTEEMHILVFFAPAEGTAQAT